jgi:hypothetical protein
MRRIEGSHIVPPGVILNHNRDEFALILSPLNVYEYRLRVLIYIKPNWEEFALILARLNVHEYRLRVLIYINHNREEFALILSPLNDEFALILALLNVHESQQGRVCPHSSSFKCS